MFSQVLGTISLILVVYGMTSFELLAGRGGMDDDLKDVMIEERNQQLCDGPLNTNCPRDGKLFGDITWHPFSDDSKQDEKSEDAMAAHIESIEYANNNPLEE